MRWDSSMRKGVGAAGAIVDGDGRILLVKHSYGRKNWELPGGGVELGESPMDGVQREVQEETGLLVEVDRLTGVYYKQEDDSLHFVFACRYDKGAPKPDLQEITDCGFFQADGLPRPMSSFTIQRILDAMSGEPDLSVRLVEPLRWEM